MAFNFAPLTSLLSSRCNGISHRLIPHRCGSDGRLSLLGKSRRCGLSLIEVTISIALLAIVSIGLIGSVIYLIRQARENRAHYYAVQYANNYVGLLSAADYKNLGSPDLESDDFELMFISSEEDPIIKYSNNEKTDHAIELKIWFEFTGWGKVAAATEKSLTITLPSNHKNWESNEWARSYMTITKTPSGRGGQGQVVRVISNGDNTLSVVRDLTGTDTSEGLAVVPEVGSDIIINNGKTVRMYIKWGNGRAYRTLIREIIIARPL
jgi:type II secretory pathway component PulJ